MKCPALVIVAMLTAVPVSAQPAATDALQSRVTIDYRAAAATDVIRSLATAAGLRVEIEPGTLQLVTVTLTNVKLGTALNAVCENASCIWQLQGTLRVRPIPTETKSSLPARVSLDLQDAPLIEVFRALATAINVSTTIDPGLSNPLVTLKFNEAPTASVLNMLCGMYHCEWEFDTTRGLQVRQKKK